MNKTSIVLFAMLINTEIINYNKNWKNTRRHLINSQIRCKILTKWANKYKNLRIKEEEENKDKTIQQKNQIYLVILTYNTLIKAALT